MTLRLCEELCRGIALDVRLDGWELRRALAGRCLTLVPMVNPDGADIALHGSATAGGCAAMVTRLGGDIPGRWQANAGGWISITISMPDGPLYSCRNARRASAARVPGNGAAQHPKANPKPEP